MGGQRIPHRRGEAFTTYLMLADEGQVGGHRGGNPRMDVKMGRRCVRHVGAPRRQLTSGAPSCRPATARTVETSAKM